MVKRIILVFLPIMCSSIVYGSEYGSKNEERISRKESGIHVCANHGFGNKKSLAQYFRDLQEAAEKFARELKDVEAIQIARKSQEFARVQKEQEQIEKKRRALAAIVPPVNSSIILYNANVPLELLTLTERGNVVREGKPRSPSNKPIDQSLWDIPVNTINAPFTLSVKIKNKIFVWYVHSIGVRDGYELCLIRKKVPHGFKLILKQIGGRHDIGNGECLPLLSVARFPQKQFSCDSF